MADPKQGEQILGHAEDYTANLAALEERSVGNTTKALRSSLEDTLGSLRRAYTLYNSSLGEVTTDPNGNPVRRPGSYSAAEAAAKFRGIIAESKGFLKPAERKAWEAQYAADLEEAINLGGNMAADLAAVVAPGKGKPFTGPAPGAINAAVLNASAYIEKESQAFRDQMVNIVASAAAQGKSSQTMLGKVRSALEGVALDPKGLNKTMGLRQRAALIARSELQNTYNAAALSHYEKQGFAYVRWVATESERTCPYCVARHGRIFAAKGIMIPAHPRCRCVSVPVPAELVEEENPAIRDALLDGAFWRGQQRDALAVYAEANKLPPARARSNVLRALITPTASERRRFPGIEESQQESVSTDAPGGGQTLEEALQEREAIAKARKALTEQKAAEDAATIAADQAKLQEVLDLIPPEFHDGITKDWSIWTEQAKADAVKGAQKQKAANAAAAEADYQTVKANIPGINPEDWVAASEAMKAKLLQTAQKEAADLAIVTKMDPDNAGSLAADWPGLSAGAKQKLLDAANQKLAQDAANLYLVQQSKASFTQADWDALSPAKKDLVAQGAMLDLAEKAQVLKDWPPLAEKVEKSWATLDPGQKEKLIKQAAEEALIVEKLTAFNLGMDPAALKTDPDWTGLTFDQKMVEAQAGKKKLDSEGLEFYAKYGGENMAIADMQGAWDNISVQAKLQKIDKAQKAKTAEDLKTIAFTSGDDPASLANAADWATHKKSWQDGAIQNAKDIIDGVGFKAYEIFMDGSGVAPEKLAVIWGKKSYTEKMKALGMIDGLDPMFIEEWVKKNQKAASAPPPPQALLKPDMSAIFQLDGASLKKLAEDMGLDPHAGDAQLAINVWDAGQLSKADVIPYEIAKNGAIDAKLKLSLDEAYTQLKGGAAIAPPPGAPPPPPVVMSLQSGQALYKVLGDGFHQDALQAIYEKLSPDQQVALNTWAGDNTLKSGGVKKPSQAVVKALALDYAVVEAAMPQGWANLHKIKNFQPGVDGTWKKMGSQAQKFNYDNALAKLQGGEPPVMGPPKGSTAKAAAPEQGAYVKASGNAPFVDDFDPLDSIGPINPSAIPSGPAAADDPFTLNGKDYVPGPRLGGSTGAILYTDANGVPRLVVKKGGAPGQNDAEYTANKVYAAMADAGLPVSAVTTNYLPDGRIASDFLTGGVLLKDLSSSQRAQFKVDEQIRQGLLADALLANWDFLGMGSDNMMLSGGKLYRIDNGGTFNFRAQGKPKPFDAVPMEVFSLRKSSGQANSAWAAVDDGAYRDLWTGDLDRMLGSRTAALEAMGDGRLPPEIRDSLGKRYDTLEATKNALIASGIAGKAGKTKAVAPWQQIDAAIETVWAANASSSPGMIEKEIGKALSNLQKSWVAQEKSVAEAAKVRAQLGARGLTDPDKAHLVRGSVDTHGSMPWGQSGSITGTKIKAVQDYYERSTGIPITPERAQELIRAVEKYTNGNYTPVQAELMSQNAPRAFQILIDNMGRDPRAQDARTKAKNLQTARDAEELVHSMPVWRGKFQGTGGTKYEIQRGIGFNDVQKRDAYVAYLAGGGEIGTISSWCNKRSDWGGGASASLVLHCENPKTATSVREISSHTHEDEILYGSNARFRVVRVGYGSDGKLSVPKRGPDDMHVWVEEI
jgi:SPP1 gp7 family putative phage head morphogenesis protein